MARKYAILNKVQSSSDVIRYTNCGYHCWRHCILKVRVRNGVIISCEPDDTINAGIPREDGYVDEEVINRGMTQTRPCAKGYTQAHMVYDSRRVKYPMKRIGKRGEGNFQRISWDEALDTIAEKLVEVKEKHGPYSIMHHPYSFGDSCSFPLAPWFGAGIAGWEDHSHGGWWEPEKWVFGRDIDKGQFYLAQDEVNIFKSRLIVLWGLNPLTTLSGGWAHNLLRAKERGIPVICIEPRYTPSAEVLADQWIPIRPTTDVAMMIAMANLWFKENLCDEVFIKKWVEPEGLRLWRAYVLGISDGLDKNTKWAERICGVPAETIEAFARLYAKSRPVNLNVSLSIGRQFWGENPCRAAMYLQALTGNTCVPGGTAGAETGEWPGQLRYPVPRVDTQRKAGTYRAPVLLNGFKWAKAIDMRERLDKGEISKADYNNMIGNAASNPCPNIQMVIMESNNPVNSLPDINCTIRALNKVDFVLISSQYTDLATSRYADILLPQIYMTFEGGDVLGFWRPISYGTNPGNMFVYRQKCIDPPGEVKPNGWVWTQIARRLGIAEMYNPRMVNVHDEDWQQATESPHREAYERWSAREDIAHLNPPSWAEFLKKPVFRWEIKEPNYPFKRDLERGENPFRGTGSGKIEFYSKFLAKGKDYLTESVPGTGRCYGPGNLPPMASMTMGGKGTFYGRDAEKYPLLMSSPHSFYRVHSFLDNQPWLSDDCYRHAVWINISDARSRGIIDNNLVKVHNDQGQMILPAYVTGRVVPGTVFIFHGSWYKPDANNIDRRGAPNLLIHNEDLPQTIVGMFPCKALVQIEKWEAA